MKPLYIAAILALISYSCRSDDQAAITCPPFLYNYKGYKVQFPIDVESAKINYRAPIEQSNALFDNTDLLKSGVVVYYTPYKRSNDSVNQNDEYKSIYAVAFNRPINFDSVSRSVEKSFKLKFVKKTTKGYPNEYYLLRVDKCYVIIIYKTILQMGNTKDWYVAFGNSLTDEEVDYFVESGGAIHKDELVN